MSRMSTARQGLHCPRDSDSPGPLGLGLHLFPGEETEAGGRKADEPHWEKAGYLPRSVGPTGRLPSAHLVNGALQQLGGSWSRHLSLIGSTHPDKGFGFIDSITLFFPKHPRSEPVGDSWALVFLGLRANKAQQERWAPGTLLGIKAGPQWCSLLPSALSHSSEGDLHHRQDQRSPCPPTHLEGRRHGHLGGCLVPPPTLSSLQPVLGV